MTPTSVQFNSGPEKYEMPFLNASLSSLRSLDIAMACASRVAAIRRRLRGLVDLPGPSQLSAITYYRRLNTHRRIESSMPSLPLSNSVLVHVSKVDISSPLYSPVRYIIADALRISVVRILSPTANVEEPNFLND